MFFGRKSSLSRRERIETAESAVEAAMAAIASDDVKLARIELGAAPKTHFADAGWRVELAAAVIELASGKLKNGNQRLMEVCRRLDETSLSADEHGYVRLFALYRAAEAAKDGRAPEELRDIAENFQFDHLMVSPAIKSVFPLKKTGPEQNAPPPPEAAAENPEDG